MWLHKCAHPLITGELAVFTIHRSHLDSLLNGSQHTKGLRLTPPPLFFFKPFPCRGLIIYFELFIIPSTLSMARVPAAEKQAENPKTWCFKHNASLLVLSSVLFAQNILFGIIAQKLHHGLTGSSLNLSKTHVGVLNVSWSCHLNRGV